MLTFLAALALAGCHSNEENYREAYEKARNRVVDAVGDTAYNLMMAERIRYTTVVNGDSVRLLHMHCNVTDDSPSEVAPYGVVVAQFKQVFNARNYRDRLRSEEGFPAYVLYGGTDGIYYVCAKTFDDLDMAVIFLKTIDKSMKMDVLEPRAWIIHRL